jgi:hypothetical protein
MKYGVIIACIVAAAVSTFAACSQTDDASGRLIYVSAASRGQTPRAASPNSSSSASSRSASSASSKSARSSGASGSSSGKKSSGGQKKAAEAPGKADDNGTGGQAAAPQSPLSVADAVSVYNCACAKNAAFRGGMQYDFTDRNSVKNFVLTGTVKYDNDPVKETFAVNYSGTGGIYHPPGSGSIYSFNTGDAFSPCGSFKAGDEIRFVQIVDPQLTAGEISAWSMTGDAGAESIDFKLSAGFGKYSDVLKIFSSSGAINGIDLKYDIRADGFIGASRQIFSLADGSSLELDKKYKVYGVEVVP